ncbi:hypothetical protein MBRA1_001192 [Malassezia brasiliensis]|uniref:ferric-chelate reductase (NADPH) n=1 Tax=Malassezia brasiliensis TaxID=1821822 RepID=A0AAF0IP59_9BASI|nr:hypothetical protein MBRA1_001192 [Malassezia brasiliensis]
MASAAQATVLPPSNTGLVGQGMTYLDAHELSKPSERYVYIFWILLACMGLALGLEHLVGLTDRTFFGALWCKWSTSNHVARLLRAPRPLPQGAALPYTRSFFRRAVSFLQRHAFLSFNLGRLTAIVVILLPVLCLTFIGYDYIDPRRGVFEMDTSTKTTLTKRSVAWGIGEHTPISFEKPSGTLPYHTWWTIGSRTGDMSNALTPLVVLFALKQVPFALMALPIFGSFSLDSLSFLHKWAGCLLWVYATVHTVTWLIQVANDAHRIPNLWNILLHVPRFRWAVCAYIFLTLLVIFSITPFRRAHYEIFYVTHVVCVLGFMIATWAHHPQLGWWMLAALLLWMLERLTRIVRVMWINYSEKPSLLREAKHAPLANGGEHELSTYPSIYSTDALNASRADFSAPSGLVSPLFPYGAKNASISAVDLGAEPLPKLPVSHSAYSLQDVGSLPPPSGTSDGRGDVPMQPLAPAPHTYPPSPGPRNAWQSSAALSQVHSADSHAADRDGREGGAVPEHGVPMALAAPFRPVISQDLRMQLFPGYAFIQPLAGNMMRLVLRTASPLRWRPGQWLYLQLPRLSWFQSHPFTIASSFTKPKHGFGPGDVVAEEDCEQLVLLLIRMRGGLTRRLWDYVQRECQVPQVGASSLSHPTTFPVLGHETVPSQVRGVYMRAIIDGPYGSSGRIDWGAYQSAVLVCGGSGVSYGMSVLEHLCRKISRVLRGEDVRGLYGRPFLLRRVCFVWVMREFAHLQWAASALRLCLEMLPPENLHVQMYVTHVNQKQVVEHHSPSLSSTGSPSMPTHPNSDATGTGAVSFSVPGTEPGNIASRVVQGNDLDHVALGGDDLTQFDQEEDGPLTAMDRLMNEHIMREGKMRRAQSRKRSIRRRQRTRAPSPPPAPSTGYARQHADWQARNELQNARNAPRDAHIERPIATPGSLMAFTEQAFAPPNATPGFTALVPPTPLETPSHEAGSVETPGAARVMSPAPLVTGGTPLSPTMGVQGTSAEPQDYFSIPPHAGTSPTSGAMPLPRHAANDHASVPMPPPEMTANLDASEISDFEIVAELTRAGYPKLDEIIGNEMERANGRTMTACCGPAGLLAVVRAIVAKHINVYQVWRGDLRGHANLYGESYDT